MHIRKKHIWALNAILSAVLLILLAVCWIRNRPQRTDDYFWAAERASAAISEYYRIHGRWPADASDLPDPSVMVYRGQALTIDQTNRFVSIQLPGDALPHALSADADCVANPEIERSLGFAPDTGTVQFIGGRIRVPINLGSDPDKP